MIFTREDARKAIVAHIQAHLATLPVQPVVQWDNMKAADLSKLRDPYLQINIIYIDAPQINLGQRPEHRVMGQIVLAVAYPEGSGTAKANELLDPLYRHVHMSDAMFPVRTNAARFSSRPAFQAWAAQAALVPFWYDTQ